MRAIAALRACARGSVPALCPLTWLPGGAAPSGEGSFGRLPHRVQRRRAATTPAEDGAGTKNPLGIKEQAGHVRMHWSNGAWKAPEWVAGENTVTLHLHASCLHYGGSIFEGFKVFECQDGVPRMCNAAYNADRLNLSAARMGLPAVPPEVFLAACRMAVKGNRAMVPPYRSGEALYIRPLLLATGPILGIKIPCPEFTFLVCVQPLGNYVDPAGLDARVAEFDRAAPRGTGHAKAAGNYGGSVAELHSALREGYHDILYLDPLTRTRIDEFHGANFIAVAADTGAVVVPDSGTILASSTRRMLVQLAGDAQLPVELRQVELQELLDGRFSEVGACGTSYVVTRLRSLTDAGGTVHRFGELQVLERLRERFVQIQRGEAEDVFGWLLPA